MAINVYIIHSTFNALITQRLLDGALTEARKNKLIIPEEQIISVPGALELPFMAKKVIERKKPDAVIVLGAIIKGSTDHYEYVCQNSMNGVTQVALETGVPVINGILTTQTHGQAESRAGQSRETNKGAQAVVACIALLDNLSRV